MAWVRSVVSSAWLAEAIRTAKAGTLRVLDCSWYLPTVPRNGRKEFKERHIPGAVFFDLDECSDTSSPYEHMMPSAEHFGQYVGALGIGNATHVVVYDASDWGMFCSPRVWWMFRAFGHRRVSVLDGGLKLWCRQGLPVTAEIQQLPPAQFQPQPRPLVKSFEQVLDNIDSKEFQLVDSRPSGRFQGTQPEPRPGFDPGHIPGSVNIPFIEFLDPETLRIKSEKELRSIFEECGVDLSRPLVGTCGTGVSACHIALAANLCGQDDVMIYDGAWVEWFKRANPSYIISVKSEKTG
ncbi:3-mercaptopyruvate sulfurtransferase [Hypanus sabinus]|uniref:3-mercaptopyruvate sulfurtransferase n=1 Tax=Hypanus sabinus TaxID=79690 RepID=UPI0028C4584E|nr:3-mercaptopyruvate sulfurtransferase [Hypanus sabinus]